MRNMLGSLFLALAAACSSGCPHNPKPGPVPPSIVDGGPATCADMCRRLDELNCPGEGTTPEGASCLEVCENLVSMAKIDLECRARAGSCEVVDRCEVK